MKRFLKSRIVSVFTIFILLTAVAFFGNIVSTHAASITSRVSPYGATLATRQGEGSSPTTGGTLQWRYLTGYVIVSSPAVVSGVVYVGSGDNYIYSLNAGSGTLRWRYLTLWYVVSSAAVVNGVVYIGSDDGYLYALTA